MSGRPAAPSGVRRVYVAGTVLLGCELVGYLLWSTLLASRFALTWDFAIYHQAWYLIAHGDLDPFDTVEGYAFWANHAELLVWVLAPLYWIWPHAATLLYVQDLSVVGAETVAFSWLTDIAARSLGHRDAACLAAVGFVLLAADPWILWAISFDFHLEIVAALLALLVARDVARRRRRAALWVVLLLACGAVAATYLVGIGAGAMLAGRRWRWAGASLALLGVLAVVALTIVHGDRGVDLGTYYGYLAAAGQSAPEAHAQAGLARLLAGVVTHPAAVGRALWAKRVDVWAATAPGGLVGTVFPWALPLVAVVVASNGLVRGDAFLEPGFQDIAIYLLVPVGTVAVLSRIVRRDRRAGIVVAMLLAADALAWAAVWVPQVPTHWLRVSAPAASTLLAVEERIGPGAEVLASQGILGRFSARRDVRPIFGPGALAIDRHVVWVVVAPAQGVETQGLASAGALLAALVGPRHARLVVDAHGIWAVRWLPAPGTRSIVVPGHPAQLPGWYGAGTAGHADTSGPPARWRAVASGAPGYVVDGLSWREPAGRYSAVAALAASGPTHVEVWDDSSGALLARRDLPATGGTREVCVPVDLPAVRRSPRDAGWGPFGVQLVPPPPGDVLEVRVWSPGREHVAVGEVSLRRSGISACAGAGG